MALTSRERNDNERSSKEDNWAGIGEPLCAALKPLTGLIENSTAGVAFCDKRLHCQAMNRAFATMKSVSAGKLMGRTIYEPFGSDARKLKHALQRVFATGCCLANFELAPNLSENSQGRRWLVNLYPITDEPGRVSFVAVTFSELTNGDSLEFHLGCLVAKFQEALSAHPNLLSEGFTELLRRSLQLANRFLESFKASASAECLASDVRIEARLMPLALFLALTQSQMSVLTSAPRRSEAGREATKPPDSSKKRETSADNPSPRELQVLHQLSEGKSNKEIGVALAISTRTVETYRARVMRKLNLHSTAELVRYSIRNKITEL